jgi:thiamine biosynthesis lipoprotein
MGAPYRVTWVDTPGAEGRASQLQAQVVAELQEFDRTLTTYAERSPLLDWNRARSRAPLPVPEVLLDCLDSAREVFEATGGAYDVTLLPLVRLWGFGPGGPPGDGAEPGAEELARVKARIGLQHLKWNRRARTLSKALPEMELDLNSLAPGLAADRVGGLLQKLGIQAYLIDVGGELLARGLKPGGAPWVAGVETPSAEYAQGIEERVPLRDEAIATSGSYRKARWVKGKRLTHVIDPRTARPVEHRVVSVSVLQPRAVLADAWATALMVLSREEGSALAEKKKLAVLWIEQEPGGEFRLSRSSAWTARGHSEVKGDTRVEGTTGWNQALATGAVFLLGVGAMAIGVILKRRPIQGSCGGIANVMGESGCDICEKKNQCERTGKRLRPDDPEEHD